PPRCDVRCLQAVLVAKTPLDESDDRCMVERLRAYPSPLRPRRYHEHRHARPKSVRPGRIALIPAEVLVDRIDAGRARRVGPRRKWGRDMIKKAVVLIISDEKRRLAPYIRVRGKHPQYFIDVQGAIIRRPVRMLGVGFGCDDP